MDSSQPRTEEQVIRLPLSASDRSSISKCILSFGNTSSILGFLGAFSARYLFRNRSQWVRAAALFGGYSVTMISQTALAYHKCSDSIASLDTELGRKLQKLRPGMEVVAVVRVDLGLLEDANEVDFKIKKQGNLIYEAKLYPVLESEHNDLFPSHHVRKEQEHENHDQFENDFSNGSEKTIQVSHRSLDEKKREEMLARRRGGRRQEVSEEKKNLKLSESEANYERSKVESWKDKKDQSSRTSKKSDRQLGEPSDLFDGKKRNKWGDIIVDDEDDENNDSNNF
jgi:hypothetical protein